MREPFDARRHVVELTTVRQLMLVRCARIVEAGGDDTHTREHVNSLDAVLALMYGRCSVPCLHDHLGRLLANGRHTISRAELLGLLMSDDAP